MSADELDRNAAFGPRRYVLKSMAAVAGAAAVACAYRYLGRDRPIPAAARPPRVAPLASTRPATRPAAIVQRPSDREIVTAIYNKQIVPPLDAFERRNAAAVSRAMLTLHDRIQMHRAGIGPFTREIASWRTRFGVIGRYSQDLWSKVRGRRQPADVTHVRAYVDEKFRRNILSEDALRADVGAALAQFDEDMQASRNRLYAELALPLGRIKVAVPRSAAKVDRFRDDVQRRAGAMTGGMALDTVVAGMAAVAGGWVATDVAQAITVRVVTQVLTQIGTAMAAEGIEAGGATVGGAAAGGGAGSFGGPLGTIIGLGVGLIVGAIVDWRMSKRFEQKVTRQCEDFLNLVEQRLRDGRGNTPGLAQLLGDAASLTDRVQREAITAAVKETYR